MLVIIENIRILQSRENYYADVGDSSYRSWDLFDIQFMLETKLYPREPPAAQATMPNIDNVIGMMRSSSIITLRPGKYFFRKEMKI
jgi:hypothetical protein